MDPGGLGLTVHDKNFAEGVNMNKNEDRLSTLPDVIVCDILTLLLTKDAIRTTALSKRWKYSWRSITTLNIKDKCLLYSSQWRCRRADFMNFIDNLLLLLGNHMIHQFYLSCSEKYDASRVHTWISNIMRRNIQKLSIIFDSCDPTGWQSFHNHLLDNDSLTELDLRVCWTFKVSSCICFSRLRVLTLCTVKFLNEGLPRSSELRINFPLLEVLNLMNCAWQDVEVVNIGAPVLNNFHVYEPIEMRDCVVNIQGSSLTKFRYDGWGYGKYILTNPTSVIDATISDDSISLLPCFRDETTGMYTCILLRQFSSLKYLTLPFETIEALSFVYGLQEQLPTMKEVIHLTIRSQIHVLEQTLIALLWRMPFLEALVFTNFEPPPACIANAIKEVDIKKGREPFMEPQGVPPCLQSQLKAVKLENFHGSKYVMHEFELAKFLLENALVLEEMTVTISGILQSDINALKEELLALPRGSDHVIFQILS